MDIATLIGALADPRAWPFAVSDVEVRQTHISAVFAAGNIVYKVKKPVQLSFLDFSTLEKRRHFCSEEVRLNRRLAPDVYLGVVPVTEDRGRIGFEGSGPTVDWAVKMRRLPDAATLEQYVLRDEIDAAHLRPLAARLAVFHAEGLRSEHIREFGRFDVVAGNIRENFAVSAPTVGLTISPAVRGRVVELTEQALHELQPVIDSRAGRGVPCDTHGDLHLDHVYLFPDRPPPADLVVIDCIEFNERFRYADPIADMAFLAMDLEFHGRRDLARALADAYFAASGDVEGRGLLPLYVSYRAAVRGKVDGLQLVEREIPEAARRQALVRARGHWLLALGALEVPDRRPALVLVGGLPGSGKSFLAAKLATRTNFQVIRSDVVRKELAGIPAGAPARAAEQSGIYTPEWTDRTYAECLQRAEARLFEGERVIVDATFIDERRREAFFDAALHWGVPVLFLLCEADPATIRARLEARRGDASDADWDVYRHASRRWVEPGRQIARWMRRIATGGSADVSTQQAWNALQEAGLTGRGELPGQD
jgi:aminoglycoside phosphotransferase family enzyme/predicted kinase